MAPLLRYYAYSQEPRPNVLHPDGSPPPSRESEILAQIKEDEPADKPLKKYLSNLEMPLVCSPGGVSLPCRETLEEFEAVNAHFSGHIHALFNALEACEDANAQDELPRIHQGGMNLGLQIGRQSYDIHLHCWHRNIHSHRLYLKDAAKLPFLSRVTKFQILSTYKDALYNNVRPVSLRVPLECAARLPDLQELECPWLWERTQDAFVAPALRHFTRVWEGQWRDSRHEFGRAVDELHNQMPPSLRSVKLWFWRPAYDWREDQGIEMPNLIHPADEDPVSAGLRTMASGIEEFDVRAFLTPNLFKTPLQWGKMKHLRVEFHPLRPDGCWYFVGPRGEDPNSGGFEVTDAHYAPTRPNEDDEEWDEDWDDNGGEDDEFSPNVFRTEPKADMVEPLLSAFAKALKGMPVLEEAELFTHLSWKPSDEMSEEYGDDAPYDHECSRHRWGVRYVPGKNGSKGLVEWQVGEWRPREDVIKLFEDLGEDVGIDMTWKAFEFMKWPGLLFKSTLDM